MKAIDASIRAVPWRARWLFLDGISPLSSRLAHFQEIYTYVKANGESTK